MSKKRNATKELNHDNWNQAEEDEDPGTFEPLPTEKLQNRVIKKAVRRNVTNTESGSGKPSPFSMFSGFQSLSSTPFTQKSAAPSPFSGLFKKEAEKTNGDPPKKDPEPTSSSSNTNVAPQKPTSDSNVKLTGPKQIQPRNMDYYVQLRSLNESVLKWMQLHLEKNACCDFTPVFNDYKKYMDSLAVNYPVLSQDADTSEQKGSTISAVVQEKTTTLPKAAEAPTDSSQIKDKKTDYGAHFSSNTTNTSTFSFGMKSTPSATSPGSNEGPTSSSKQGEEKKETSTPFSFGLKSSGFGSGTGFSFSTQPVSSAPADGEEEYVPPKNEVATVVEEGAIYSKKCKMFFKKDGSFAEKGVGMLHIKKIDDKSQLLIRADTILGNILLNIALGSSLPMSRTGKNNVLIACIPNPPVDPKKPDSKETVPILIRVKTAEDADELLEKLNEHKS